MSKSAAFVGISIGACLFASSTAAAAAAASPPDLAPNPSVGWAASPGPFLPPPSGPGPVPALDVRHASSNAGFFERGAQPIFEMGNPDAPILQPWAKEQVRMRNEAILAGKPGFTRQASCWPVGTPAFLLYPQQPVYFVQTPKEVVMIWQGDHQVRHVYLDTPHSKNPKPSWYGESVGHYEGGDTLVVDTIGLSTKSYVDNYRTPHTEQLHVVERFKMSPDGKSMEDFITVDDPGAFTRPWSGSQRFNLERSPLEESVCAENNVDFFHYDVVPLPQADKPDF